MKTKIIYNSAPIESVNLHLTVEEAQYLYNVLHGAKGNGIQIPWILNPLLDVLHEVNTHK